MVHQSMTLVPDTVAQPRWTISARGTSCKSDFTAIATEKKRVFWLILLQVKIKRLAELCLINFMIFKSNTKILHLWCANKIKR